MSKTLNARICQPIDTEARWLEVNPILLKGERVFVEINGELKEKIGDGISNFSALEYLNIDSNNNAQIITVSSAEEQSQLSNNIPNDGEQYIIKYTNIPYYDVNHEKQENENPLYVEKIGDGTHNLTELPAIRSIVAGNEGEGSLIQFLESELYEILDEGKETAKTPRSIVTGKGSVAFGRYNTVHSRESFATNYNNTVNGKWSAAFNQNNTIEAADDSIGKKSENLFVAGGTNNKISGDQGAVLGSANKSNGTHYIILGDNNTLGDSANFVRVLGKGLRSNGVEQILLGTFNAEDDNARVIIASGDSTSNPRNSIVIKKDGRIELEGNITHKGTINNNSTIVAKALISSSANIENTIIARSINTAGGNTVGSQSLAVGANNTVSSATSAAFGSGNTVSISHGFAAGEGNEVSGENAYAAAAFGRKTKAHGLYSLVEGVSSKTEAAGSHVEGYSCKSNPKATGSHVGGSGSEASTPYAFVHGLKLKTIESDNGTNSPAVFGRYNEADEHALFSVGNGTSDADRKNAFTVNDDNSITIGDVNLTADELNNMKSGFAPDVDTSNFAKKSDLNAYTELSEFEEYKTEVANTYAKHTDLDNLVIKNHASSTTEYGVGTSAQYGHVKITDDIDNANSATAASPSMVKTVKTNITSEIERLEGIINDESNSITNLENDFNNWAQGQNLPYKYGTSAPTTDQLQPYQLYFQYA